MSYNILITGANRGLGLTLTEQFLTRGHKVYAINRRESDALSQLRDKHPDNLLFYSGDVADETSIQNALETIAGQVDHLDIVVNNAAVHLEQTAPLIEEVDFFVYLPSFQVNAVGPQEVIKYALPLLRRGANKLIANVSSEAGSIGTAWRKSEYCYCMSKAALNMASQLLQNTLKDQGIKVLSIHPGWFSSDMGGADAPITPTQAAEQVTKTLLKPMDLAGPVYVAPDAERMDW